MGNVGRNIWRGLTTGRRTTLIRRGETVFVTRRTAMRDILRGAALDVRVLDFLAVALLVPRVRLAFFVARPRLGDLPRLLEVERLRLGLLRLDFLALERLRPLLERLRLELRPLRPREDPRRAIN